MNEALAELIGMHLGDGTIYQTNTGIVWELRGGLDEKDFYTKYVRQLIFKATGFLLEPKLRNGGKNGCIGFRCCKKEFIQQLTIYNIPIGRKTQTAEIPLNILFSSKILKRACIRGLVATDGTAYVVKINNSNKTNYPIIEFMSTSEALRNQVVRLLNELGITSKTWTYNSKKKTERPAYYLRLSGKQKTKRFCEIIGLSNPKHQKRLNNNV